MTMKMIKNVKCGQFRRQLSLPPTHTQCLPAYNDHLAILAGNPQKSNAFSNITNFIPFPKFQYPISAFPKFNLMYAPSGFIEYHTLFPKSEVIPAFTELLKIATNYKRQPWVCGVKRHKKESPFLSFSEDGLAITINFPLNNFPKHEREKYSSEITSIITKYSGKVYISKHAYLSKTIFEEMYPEYKKILDLKNQYDPDTLFSSNATERLFLSNS